MGSILASLTRWLLLAAIAGGAVFPAQAQPAAKRRSQPILFSSPMDGDVVSNTSSLLPKLPDSLDLTSAADAPPQFNFDRRGEAPLPPAMPFLSPAGAARERDEADRRRNWMLLTPAEILGAVTPEQVMGIRQRDAFGQPKNPTITERYTERQNLLWATARTNALSVGMAPPGWLVPGDRQGMSNLLSGGWMVPQSPVNPLYDPAPNNQLSTRQTENRGWSKLFASTPPAASSVSAAALAQAEDMARFRQLLNPGTPSAALAATPDQGGLKTTLPQSLLNAGFARSQPTRIGASFTPLSSGIGRAADLPKLSGGLGLSYTSPPPAAVWAPQPAPWLSPAPQPFTIPQRKF
jgi:hypothetical protein